MRREGIVDFWRLWSSGLWCYILCGWEQ